MHTHKSAETFKPTGYVVDSKNYTVILVTFDTVMYRSVLVSERGFIFYKAGFIFFISIKAGLEFSWIVSHTGRFLAENLAKPIFLGQTSLSSPECNKSSHTISSHLFRSTLGAAKFRLQFP